MVQIPRDYWLGNKCIESRTPWLVPEAIHFLDKFTTKDDIVLELGCGGSTLFFADRCKRVITFEMDQGYFEHMTKIVAAENLKNVTLHKVEGINDVIQIIEDEYGSHQFNIIVPDWDIERESLQPMLPKILASRFAVVIDNYSAPNLYPKFHNRDYLSKLKISSYCSVFDDSHWNGQGTKVYSSEFISAEDLN